MSTKFDPCITFYLISEIPITTKILQGSQTNRGDAGEGEGTVHNISTFFFYIYYIILYHIYIYSIYIYIYRYNKYVYSDMYIFVQLYRH